MDEKEFRKLIKKNLYQIFIFESHLPLPIQFATHAWIVTSSKGKIKRWEVWDKAGLKKPSWGHVYLNLMPPSRGMNRYFIKRFPRNKSILVGYREGKKNSIEEIAIKFLDKNAKNYTYKNKYVIYPGPNSNTFVQWFINNFPSLKFRLSKQAIGKNYVK